MKRAFVVTSLFVLAAGCAPRERVIVIKEPSGEKNGTSAETPIASDGTSGEDSDWGIRSPGESQDFARVIDKVSGMVSDSDLQRRVQRRALSLVNVTWEDTGRAQGSSLGPNISDLSLQVRRKEEGGVPTDF